jgi:hypothetical protein
MAKDKCKKLCKLAGKKPLGGDLEEYIALVRKPKYLCTKCGRVSRLKRCLCEPRKL